ncbi:zinc finger protein [Salpingoeca rosetta]|uniref:Zinc finger protein n=1 Tax=Salpingoeca rosetta (strain ATCC 50818 / BSB-021) TaxID=946362 RepID=F2U733_SALR5|nr:zinc finger protein [Salpingoeca rosetta]EGD83665.1 zinc finger protein [Salpingoeca rosetta]|eukprot:XP_004995169.1 zinc finger protein [Salpingoeca rosetta]
MARGQQKIQAQQKAAQKKSKMAKKGGDHAKNIQKAFNVMCEACKSQMVNAKTYKQHWEAKHSKLPLPAEIKDI